MVRVFRYIYGILTVLLVILFVLTGLLSPSALSSPLYTIIYAAYALFTLTSAFFIPGIHRKLLHVLIAFLILGVAAEKTFNERRFISLGTGGTYMIPLRSDTLEFELIAFSTDREQAGGGREVHYESNVLVNRQDTVRISVNHPYRYGNYRFYQSSYRTLTAYTVISDRDTLRLFEGQSAELNDLPFTLQGFDRILKRAAIRYNGILIYVPAGKRTPFMDSELTLLPGRSETGTVLECVEVRGQALLLSVALLTLLALAGSVFIRK